MGRRQRPEVKGSDPAYSHTFLANRPKRLPNGMPPGVRIPGYNDGTEQADPPVEAEAPRPEPSPDPAGSGPAVKPAKPASDPEPKVEAKAPQPTAKPSKAPKVKRSIPATVQPKNDAADDAAPGPKRKVSLKVSMTTAHVEAMQPLVEGGLEQRDVLALAGRRTVKRFEPTPDFVPAPEGDRVPMTVAYSTTKYVSAHMLDAMRDEHDPLRLKSDAAMVRGQFETLFWSVLEEVIEELGQQRG